MADPVLHLLAGPNGAGKTTFFDHVLGPATHLGFVNAGRIAERAWPGDELRHAYEASRQAAQRRAELIADRRSFATETVFSHEAKVELVAAARQAGFLIFLHVVLVPEDLAVARVVNRVGTGGHDVPEDKVRERWRRLWRLVGEAIALADEARVCDNARIAEPFRLVATFRSGRLVGTPTWPSWTPPDLLPPTRGR